MNGLTEIIALSNFTDTFFSNLKRKASKCYCSCRKLSVERAGLMRFWGWDYISDESHFRTSLLSLTKSGRFKRSQIKSISP